MDREQSLKQIEEVVSSGKFKASWESLMEYQPPQWYKASKFGIFIHWGIYAVPAFNNEWYPRNMYIQGTAEFEHHIATYGPHKEFGYKDFIPMFKAEKFNAHEWAELFEKSGARYVIPVAEHHDGFQMYKSDISIYNACNMGPERDVLGELKAAFLRHNLIIGASSHRIEHWFFLGHGKEFDSDIKEPLVKGDFYWPSMPEYDHNDINSPSPSEEFMEDWLLRTCELVDRYQPRVIYFDWWVQHSAMKPYLKKFAAYYYNRAVEWDIEVVINYKHDAFMFGSAIVDVERGHFSDTKPYYWQSCTSVARNSWCHTTSNVYKTAAEILCELVDIVSKNGNLLLNIGPKADGTIPEEDRKILEEIGKWLSVNGEAIYDTSIWRLYGEGPTRTEEGHFTENSAKEYTSGDIRFTVKGSRIYATVLKYPDNGEVIITSFAERSASKASQFAGIIQDVSVLGFEEKPVWKRTEEGLIINTCNVHSDKPVALKLLVD